MTSLAGVLRSSFIVRIEPLGPTHHEAYVTEPTLPFQFVRLSLEAPSILTSRYAGSEFHTRCLLSDFRPGAENGCPKD